MAKQTRETRILVKRMREALDAARTPLLRGAVGALGALPALALANPSGGQVVAGTANISNPSANGTVIHQGSQNAVINWQQFSVGSGQYVQFIQPNSSAVVLNRVIGGNPSQIFGDIKANGQVFLVNPNGIFFAPGATLDAQGIVASTLDIKDSDFMAGRYLFQKGTGAPDATVVNQGSLTAGSHGYVVLAGDYVENDGRIDAQLGRVYLAAGGSATLTLQGRQLISYVVDSATLSRLAGVDNAGVITANGGGVVMTADVANALTATAVNNSGFVTAHSVHQGKGVIVLAAEGGAVENSGTLDASAAAWAPGIAGGTVLIRGAGDTRLDPSSVIDTGGNGAPGGFIELSGHDLSIHGQVNAGRGGNLLLDPATITIEASGSAVAGNCSGCEGGIIHTNFIDFELNNNIDLTIIASNQIVKGSGAKGAGLPTNITALTGNGKLALKIGTINFNSLGGGTLGRITSSIFHNTGSLDYTFVPIAHGIISLAGLTINIKGAFVADASLGAVTLGNVTAKSINVTGNNLTVGNLTATGAAPSTGIVLTASHAGSATQINTGNLKTTGGGDITVITGGNGDQNISIAGSVNAKGVFKASAHAVGSGANGADIIITGNVLAKSITLVGSAGGGGGHIQTKSLHANGGATTDNVHVQAAAGAVAFSSGYVQVTGAITADHGGITLSGRGGGDSGGGGVTVTGAINAAGAASITGDYIGSSKGDGGGRVQLANVTGKTVSITAHSSNPNIKVGNVTATGAAGSLHIFGSGVGSGTGSRAAIISAGSLTATNGHGQVSVNLSHVNAAAGIKLGAIDAPLIGVSLDGNGDVVTGALTAVSTAAEADINISAFNGAAGAANHVIVNGNITAQGKTPAVTGGFSSGPFGGVPLAAGVGLVASGSCACAHDVKVSGNVVITANGRHFTHTSHNESGPTTIVTSGSGGVANFVVAGAGAAGSADVTGAITVTGPEAAVAVLAHTVAVHNVAVTGQGQNLSRKVTVAAKVTFTSTNSAGDGFVELGGASGSYGGPTQTVTAGNITVSGRGFAAAGLFASHVTAGNVAATATAAKGSIAGGSGSSGGHANLFSGLANGRLGNGTLTAGIAEVAVGKNPINLGSQGTPAVSVTLGAVTATGVGRANITLAGQKVNTKALTAIATKGLEAGSGSTLTGSVAVNKTTHKFNVNGGEVGVDIDTGSGSGTSINVAGNVSASGPTAGVRLKGKTVKVSGNVSAVGTGGALTSDTVFKPAAGTGYHVHFVGPGSMDAVSLGNSSGAGSVNVGGTVSVKGQGLVGVQVTAAKVNLGGLSASASAAAAYSILDTRKSATADVFTAGSVAVFVVGTNGSNTAPAIINGAVNINAPHGNVILATELHTSGQVNITAGSSINMDLSKVGPRISEISNAIGRGSGSFSSGGVPPFTLTATGAKLKAGGNVLLGSAPMNVGGGALSISAARSVVLSSANLTAGKVTVVAGSSIDLTGATAKVSGEMELTANKNIIMTGVNLNVGVLDATASGSILDGGTSGTITAGGLALVAGKNIAMQSTAITVGNGTVPGVSGDALLLLGLSEIGLSPGSPAPNATFIAGGNLTLGDFTLTGSYLYMQAANITFLGKVTVPVGTLVQISPINPAATIGVEDQPATGSNFNLSNSLDLSLFAGDTIAIGNGLQTGDVTLGNNGTINIGDTNLIIATSGNITGLENVISTGIVTSLESILGPPVPPPTSGEIDPNSSNNNNASGGKKPPGVNGGDTGTGQPGGTIGQDTGNASVCH